MIGAQKEKEKWIELCERAANEQGPNKLMALVTEIIFLLEAKQQGLEKTFES